MSPEEIKQLRKDLKLTARQLADAVKADVEDVWAWEKAERFPTKRFVTKMLAMREKSGQLTTKAARPSPAKRVGSGSPVGLADPLFWQLVRKLLAHPKLFASVAHLAEAYPDPAEDAAGRAKDT